MKLNQLPNNQRKEATRVGRGIGSGKGKTSGKGHKGQKARSGVSINGFEGGQMPIYRRLPKRGFTNIFRKTFQEINLSALQGFLDRKVLDAKEAITPELLYKKNIIKKNNVPVKILAKGTFSAKGVTIKVNAASKSAIEAVKKAGGTLELLAANK